MRIRVEADTRTADGTAPDDAAAMDARQARLLFGLACFELRADGSLGRSIDPTFATLDVPWPALEGHRQTAVDHRSHMKHSYETYLGATPCEAASWRDPGASR